MIDTLMWVIGPVCLMGLLLWLVIPTPTVPAAFEMPVPRPTSGPHTLIARGRVDEGHFVLVRTPLYEQPLNAVLITQVLFDDDGTMSRARYLRVALLETGKLIAGQRSGKPLTLTIGPGADTAAFPDDPTVNWTH